MSVFELQFGRVPRRRLIATTSSPGKGRAAQGAGGLGATIFWAGAAWNSEDMNVVTSAEVTEAYAAHWQVRVFGAVRFGDAADWCSRG